MKKIIFGLFVLLLNVVLILNFFDPRIAEYIKVKLKINPEITLYSKGLNTIYERMDGSVEKGSTIFLGDSITQALNVAAITDKSINYGISGDTTYGLLNRMDKYNSLNTANKIVIAIGINDLRYRNKEEIIKNFNLILDKLPQNTPILINSILPVSGTFIDKNKDYSVKKIEEINSELLGLCGKKPSCNYMDNFKLFVDKNGFLKKEYDIGDGIHLNTKGNQVLIHVLRENIKN